MPATTEKLRTTRREKENPAQEILTSELERFARQQVAVYALFDRLERQIDEISPGNIATTPAEWDLIRSTCPWIENLHHLADAIELARSARILREDGYSRESVDIAKAGCAASRRIMAKARATLNSIDKDAGELLLDHLQKQQAKLDRLKGDIEDAEEIYRTRKQGYERLLRLAPRPLRDLVEDNHRRSMAPKLKSNLRKAEAQLSATEQSIKLLESVDTSTDTYKKNSLSLNPHRVGEDANSYPWLWSLLPEAIEQKESGHGYRVKQEVCQQKAEELRTTTLPQFQAEREKLKALLEAEEDHVNEILDRWAVTGDLTTDMFLN